MKLLASLIVGGWLVAALAWAPDAAACNCPKEAMIKKYGTVSMIHRPDVRESAPPLETILPPPGAPKDPAATPAPPPPKPEPQS